MSSNILYRRTNIWQCECGMQTTSPTVKLANMKLRLHQKKCELAREKLIVSMAMDTEPGRSIESSNIQGEFDRLHNYTK